MSAAVTFLITRIIWWVFCWAVKCVMSRRAPPQCKFVKFYDWCLKKKTILLICMHTHTVPSFTETLSSNYPSLARRAIEEFGDWARFAGFLRMPSVSPCQINTISDLFSLLQKRVFSQAADGMCTHGRVSRMLGLFLFFYHPTPFKKQLRVSWLRVSQRDSSVSVLWNISEASAERPGGTVKDGF